MRLAVLGAGAWGTALGISLARRHEVALWARDENQARELAVTRTNRRYLPEFTVPDSVRVSSDLRAALEACAQLPHQIAADEAPAAIACAALSGPSFASEIARGLPAALTLASSNAEFAARIARELHGPALRIYSSEDVIGVEVAGGRQERDGHRGRDQRWAGARS
jgi:glycerol-3-phosphate dehydrogenase (NAD(P)+)